MTNQRRRDFLKSTIRTIAAATWLAAQRRAWGTAASSSVAAHPIQLGSPVFEKTRDPEALALAHRKLGLRAAYCPAVALDDTQRIQDIAGASA